MVNKLQLLLMKNYKESVRGRGLEWGFWRARKESATRHRSRIGTLKKQCDLSSEFYGSKNTELRPRNPIIELFLDWANDDQLNDFTTLGINIMPLDVYTSYYTFTDVSNISV